MPKSYVIGVDVGGTNIKLGLVSEKGEVTARSRMSTKMYGSSKFELIDGLCNEIKTLLYKSSLTLNSIQGIGVGIAGLIDPVKGVVHELPNIPGWKNAPLRKILQRKLKRPVFLENDANLITLAEWMFGAGRGCSDMLCITLGTGVGGGLILNGELYRGAGYSAGEVGHMPINVNGPNCTCGGWGCFERYVGNAPLLKEIRSIYKDRNKQIEDLYPLALKGEKRAVRFWSEFGERIADGLVGPVNLLNPEKIVIGGGVSKSYRFFAPCLKSRLKNRAMSVQGKMVKVVKATLGNDAGLIGAQVLIQKEGNI